ncbi:hypothetical protein PINS_up006888 [Pythium insidiosum]|nr:hypothetical protein PINS_up006888 [Pythium insidiosum]
MKTQQHRLFDWISDESARVGGQLWELRILGRPRTIIATSPAIFEDMLKTQVHIFEKGPLATFLQRDFFGSGILAVDGDEWFFQRKTASHLFSLRMMKDVMSDVIREKAALLHDVLMHHARKQQPLSFRKTITHFTSDVFAKIGFGVELDCLQRSLVGDDVNAFMQAFTTCSQVIQRRLQQPTWLWRLKRWLDIGDESTYKREMRVIDSLIYDIIAKSMARKAAATDTLERLAVSFSREQTHERGD